MAWTAPKTFNTGDVLPSSDLNTHLRDNLKWLHDQGADLASAATVTPTNEFHKVTGTATVDNIASPTAGHRMMLWFTGAATIRHNGGGTGNLRLVGAADRTLTADTIVEFRSDGSVWREVGSSGLGSGSIVGCRLTHSADQGISASDTTIAFDTEKYDTNAFHDTVTNNSRITIPTGMGGKYMLLFVASITGSATQNLEIQPKLNGNTTKLGPKASNFVSSSLNKASWTICDILTVSAADYVQLYADITGGTWTIDGGDPDIMCSFTKLGV